MAMAEVPDRGNPNFFSLFNGSHVAELVGSASTSNVFMLTSMNTVQFLGDCTAGADGRMWVLPEECRPKNPVRFMCPIEPTGDVPGASYEVVVDVTAESKAVEVVTGIATETSKALTQATLSTETANAAAGVELATETANAVAGVKLTTKSVRRTGWNARPFVGDDDGNYGKGAVQSLPANHYGRGAVQSLTADGGRGLPGFCDGGVRKHRGDGHAEREEGDHKGSRHAGFDVRRRDGDA